MGDDAERLCRPRGYRSFSIANRRRPHFFDTGDLFCWLIEYCVPVWRFGSTEQVSPNERPAEKALSPGPLALSVSQYFGLVSIGVSLPMFENP